MSEFSESKITVKISRWQPKSSRYRSVVHDLEFGRPVLDVLANNNGVRILPDPAVEQMILRTQRVDRIQIDATTNTVEIFMSPIIERKYKPDHFGKTTKARMSETLCTCRHSVDSHGSSGVCLVPGCPCKHVEPIGTRREIVDRKMDEIAADRTSSDAIFECSNCTPNAQLCHDKCKCICHL